MILTPMYLWRQKVLLSQQRSYVSLPGDGVSVGVVIFNLSGM